MENKKNEIKPKTRAMTLTIKAVVLNKNNEVLILKRAKNDLFNGGKYDLPGGHIEENESLEDSIIREIKEETGLDAVFGEIIDVVEFPQNSPLFKEEKRGIRCICYVNSDKVRLSSEHSKYKWIPIKKATEKFSQEDGFENEKRNTILKAQEYLEMKKAMDGWKRERADFENYKKRQAEDKKELIAFSNLNLILELLPVLDNFYASTQHIPENQKKEAWLIGIMHIQHQLEKVLKDNGAAQIIVKVGDEFNPEIHEAMDNQETKDKKYKNRVKKVLQTGYKINGKVIRPTRVIVE